MDILPDHFSRYKQTDMIVANLKDRAAYFSPSLSDDALIRQWLHDRPPHTKRAYTKDIERFQAFVCKSLREVTLADLQDFSDFLKYDEDRDEQLAVSSRVRILSAIKSLLTFGQKTGYLIFNVGAALKPIKQENRLSERILEESQVLSMIGLEKDARNHLILRMLYYSGMRVSELCGLEWRQVVSRENGLGQLAIHGKGEKTRFVLLPPPVWQELQQWRASQQESEPSMKMMFLSPAQVCRIVKQTAIRAGLSEEVSPHWLRHANASHALARGVSIAVVKETLGHANVSVTNQYLHIRPGDSSGLHLAI